MKQSATHPHFDRNRRQAVEVAKLEARLDALDAMAAAKAEKGDAMAWLHTTNAASSLQPRLAVMQSKLEKSRK